MVFPSDIIINLAKYYASISKGVGSRCSFRVGAVLFNNKCQIVNGGWNSYKTHPFVAKHSPWPYLHAETHAIIKEGLDHCKGLNILVVRILKTGELTMAEPCCYCKKIIKQVGINNTYFSNWSGLIVDV